jgi:5'(3')-deoxyribonucleotidase
MTVSVVSNFVLGLDLDGTCADFYGAMRFVAARWKGVDVDSLDPEPEWSMANWGIVEGEYEALHRFAVLDHRVFETMDPLPGSPEALGRLSAEGVRIRIITHRLILPSLHEATVTQTVRWLDAHRIPYWDLCFMREKDDVDANLYVEDAPHNIERLVARGADVVIIENGTNRDRFPGVARAVDWNEAEAIIRARYYAWIDEENLERPIEPGTAPSWLEPGNAPPTA